MLTHMPRIASLSRDDMVPTRFERPNQARRAGLLISRRLLCFGLRSRGRAGWVMTSREATTPSSRT